MMTDDQLIPARVPPPGEIIDTETRFIGRTIDDLARQIGETKQFVRSIIRGSQRIDAEIALKLERVFGVSAGTWLNLENDYRSHLAIKK